MPFESRWNTDWLSVKFGPPAFINNKNNNIQITTKLRLQTSKTYKFPIGSVKTNSSEHLVHIYIYKNTYILIKIQNSVRKKDSFNNSREET